MNAAAVFDYAAAPKEWASADCPACGAHPAAYPTTGRDRYRFSIVSRSCGVCGHVALAERMTPAAYADFYASGAYRRLVSAFHGREINDETIIPEQQDYARKLYRVLRPWALDANLLDIGGANGVVAREVGRRLGAYHLTVLDPAAAPRSDRVSVIRKPVESWEPQLQWQTILLCQTIDHLLDPAGTLDKLRRALTPGGILFVDALDYEITRELKIDHPHNFTERSLMRLLDRTGWTVLNVCRWNRHVGAACTA